MQIDTLTLMIPGCFATALASVFLFGAWSQIRTAPALLWWAAASAFNAIGLAVLIAGLSLDLVPAIMAGVGLTTLAPILVWGGVRTFSNRRVSWIVILASLGGWGLVGGAAKFVGQEPQKWFTIASFVVLYCYIAAAIWELWKQRHEGLRARWPLMGVLTIHALVFMGGSFDALTGVLILNQPPYLFSWFGATHFETIVFAMGSSLFMVLLCKERIESGYIEAAGIDPLTGAGNRRALLERGERLFSRSQSDGSPLSVVMLDIDLFKTINDTFGHAGGDRILRGFVNVVGKTLRPSDVLGRYGGEEFILVLPNTSAEAAYVIAERARRVFSETHKFLDGQPLGATVSAGVALAAPDATLEEAIAEADRAMYMAKSEGRDRVYRASSPNAPQDTKVIRLA